MIDIPVEPWEIEITPILEPWRRCKIVLSNSGIDVSGFVAYCKENHYVFKWALFFTSVTGKLECFTTNPATLNKAQDDVNRTTREVKIVKCHGSFLTRLRWLLKNES